MGVPRRQHHRTPPRRGAPHRQGQHGPDALGGALRGIEGPAGAEEGPGVFFALRDDSCRPVELVRPGDLRDVQGLAAQKGPPLVARHVEPCAAGGGVGVDKIGNGGVHRSSAWAAFIITAHSIRLRKSSQPYSYTPRMDPEAW